MNKALHEVLDQAGFGFHDEQITQFNDFFELLYEWNKRINLTAIDQQHYITHHLLDSLSVAGDIEGERVLDLGSGGGLPGVVLAIAQPQREFTLVDARNKKINFLKAVKTRLGLGNINPLHCRIEDHRPSLKYDTVVTRAFAQIGKIYRLAAPVLQASGRIVAMKGRLSNEEINQLEHIGVHYEVKSVEVYGLDAQRHIVSLYKDH